MNSSWCCRLALLALTVLALLHGVYSFMCYEKDMGDDSSSLVFCSSGTCYSIGGSVMDEKDAKKGCSEEAHEDGCITGGIPGILSAHTCYCTTPFCNAAYTPSVILPLLVLPAVLHYIL